MRALLIRAAIVAAGVAIAWLIAGRRISLVLDRVMTVRFATLPTSPLNPFETNFMTGHTPKWKRYLYYRWVWRRRSGAKLEMVWRFEQWFYSIDGWAVAACCTRIQLD